ncbi:glycosyltransferase family 4 protein [Bradyrhizobium sp. ISRA442]|uniref:glycosyltransferase family 4 protein n=1 Tax=Bradyrhizobium sp. ISRA442 TaxID=2866197 RepID=UPI00311ACE19
MVLTVLNVAYPFAPVGPDSVGGAEQVIHQLDEALVHSGHRSILVACAGSRSAGTHVCVRRASESLHQIEIEAAQRRHRQAIALALTRWPIDVVHLHGIDFHTYLPRDGPPALVTLHLPVDWYPGEALTPRRSNVWFNSVSRYQHVTSASKPHMLAPIENGIADHFFEADGAKRKFALMLARICPEKGVHLAIEAAKRANIALIIGGEVFPYAAHQRYFETQVEPALDRWRRFIGPVDLARKRRLLAMARCVLIPSLASETSSLVAREALACGTPVIAFDRGALAEIIENGRTGFLVGDESQMAQAIERASELDSGACRRSARERFSLERMTESYLSVYQKLSRVTIPGVA